MVEGAQRAEEREIVGGVGDIGPVERPRRRGRS